MHHEVDACRICGNQNLVSVLHLGVQALTGVFPCSTDSEVEAGPLELVKCHSDKTSESCGLVQLRHSYSPMSLYGDNYGYRSGLNRSMVDHLHKKVDNIRSLVDLQPGDLILDIGSNDSTLLQGYPQSEYRLLGIDPTGAKFSQYYPDTVELIPDFFSAEGVRAKVGRQSAKVITSIAMFYDLEAPLEFMEEVASVMAEDGVWLFEQSYMPTMLDVCAYDTICHEHLEYYGLRQIKWMTDRVGLEIVDVQMNGVNGGSFSVAVRKAASGAQTSPSVEEILSLERIKGLDHVSAYREFARRVHLHRAELLEFLHEIRANGEVVAGYGASTKGNVILQFCGLTERDIPCIAEVNTEKFGRCTPGSRIPIVSEEQVRATKPNYLMVLPWHFRDSIVEREREFLANGGKLFFPLPQLEVVKG